MTNGKTKVHNGFAIRLYEGLLLNDAIRGDGDRPLVITRVMQDCCFNLTPLCVQFIKITLEPKLNKIIKKITKKNDLLRHYILQL